MTTPSMPANPVARARRVVVAIADPERGAEARRLLLHEPARDPAIVAVDSAEAMLRAVLDEPAGPPDCLVLDDDLPGTSTPALLARLAGADGHCVCPVLVLGDERAAAEEDARQAGAQAVLRRDRLSPHALWLAIDHAMERFALTRALRESEERYRLLAHALPHMTWVNRVDQHVELANEKLTQDTGLTLDELNAVGWWTLVHPDDRERLWAEVTGPLERGEPHEAEYRLRWHDGTYHWVVSRGVPMRGPTGVIERWVGTTIDIDARKRADEERRAAEERLQRAIRAGGVGLWDWDAATDHTTWSDTMWTIYGRPIGDVPPQEAFDSGLHPEDREWVMAEVAAYMTSTLAEFRQELRIVRPDGTVRWIEAIADLTRDPAGRPIRMAGVNIDVTDRKAAEQALEASNRHKDEFLATLAHELRNPLAPIRHALELLRGGDVVGEAAAKCQDTMERQLGHLVRLVDDLLDVSRINRGVVELRPERITLGAIVEHAVELGRPLIEASEHSLEIRAPDQPVWLHGDLTRLAQAVGNLLHNAAKYTPPGGHIELSTAVVDGQAWIRVADDGIGIDPAMLPRVFDLFARVDRRLERTHGGLGIGLSLARTLVELHDGTLVASSPGLGRGSTFTIRLPLATEAAGPSAPASEAPASPSPRRILVVDDNYEAAEMLTLLLEIEGHETATAHGGAEALALARAWRPEVVFLDIGMPEMNGYEVARHLRADPSTADAVLVALTGWGSEDDKRKSSEAGFDLHLVKPVGRKELVDVLARLPARARPAAGGSGSADGPRGRAI